MRILVYRWFLRVFVWVFCYGKGKRKEEGFWEKKLERGLVSCVFVYIVVDSRIKEELSSYRYGGGDFIFIREFFKYREKDYIYRIDEEFL